MKQEKIQFEEKIVKTPNELIKQYLKKRKSYLEMLKQTDRIFEHNILDNVTDETERYR
tara:strand:- start:567 stop:740 length:174 start_codon:yes stop_codon:yes gene_type:complete